MGKAHPNTKCESALESLRGARVEGDSPEEVAGWTESAIRTLDAHYRERLDLQAGRIQKLEDQVQGLGRSVNAISQILVSHGLAKNEGTRKFG